MTIPQGMIPASDAANQSGKPYGSILKCLRHKMLKGYKLKGRWYVDIKDLQRAVAAGVVPDPRYDQIATGVREVILKFPEREFILVEQLLAMKNQKIEDILTNTFYAQRDSLRGLIEPVLKRL